MFQHRELLVIIKVMQDKPCNNQSKRCLPPLYSLSLITCKKWPFITKSQKEKFQFPSTLLGLAVLFLEAVSTNQSRLLSFLDSSEVLREGFTFYSSSSPKVWNPPFWTSPNLCPTFPLFVKNQISLEDVTREMPVISSCNTLAVEIPPAMLPLSLQISFLNENNL